MAQGMMLIEKNEIRALTLQCGLDTREKLQVGARTARLVTYLGKIYHAYWPYQWVNAPKTLPEGVAYV